MASRPIPGTQNFRAVSDCLTFGAGRGSPKALEHGLSGPEALGMHDLKYFLRGVKFEKNVSLSPDIFFFRPRAFSVFVIPRRQI